MLASSISTDPESELPRRRTPIDSATVENVLIRTGYCKSMGEGPASIAQRPPSRAPDTFALFFREQNMINTRRMIASPALAVSMLMLVAAQRPSPTPTFAPALAYRYTSGSTQDIRLGNADGSAAVLLVRVNYSSRNGAPISRFSLAPLSQRRLAYIDNQDPKSRKIRLVSWSQSNAGGPIAVAPDAEPLFSAPDGFWIGDVAFSPDGSQVAVVGESRDGNSTLRLFDVTLRTQIGDPIPLPYGALYLSWRSDGALFMSYGSQASVYQDGTQTPLWNFPMDGRADTSNVAPSNVVLSYNGYLWRWDGSSVQGDAPVLTRLGTPVYSFDVSVRCDDQAIIHRTGAMKRKVFIFAGGVDQLYSSDDNITFPSYPNSCE